MKLVTSIFQKHSLILIQNSLRSVQMRLMASASLNQAADMYNYNEYSYYDIELSMEKYRLKQPSAFDKLIPDPPPPKK
ncbi:unnamed protein product [Didymodactylos carnosus]|uniref:NADH-ubiquinone oxidoreductase 9 kDa subunit n=1 Tax=Didymodactylos carnosus TaxID=1234261 RepID=A0A814NMF2_9BILA|nr:unnamed protein product [Didymodactylos carnosus]CAF1093935.1 unnamed protein product [Didymodactylos carnosus]CAF3595083.1 unnamed protein product [Didymodactylos carnosus]CAF3859291.1 unnamed protein product [Didymodactylos carnosus]